ncbi:hypothetical protein DFS33DRAFT_1380496 [Desarmillaria ectypa]|nr:hypothetical protein DFS33DRAFT_1380496 [Desarmillaria ectypa]
MSQKADDSPASPIDATSMSQLVSGEYLPRRETDAGRIDVEDEDGDILVMVPPEYEEIFSSGLVTGEHSSLGEGKLPVPVVTLPYHTHPKSEDSDVSVQCETPLFTGLI